MFLLPRMRLFLPYCKLCRMNFTMNEFLTPMKIVSEKNSVETKTGKKSITSKICHIFNSLHAPSLNRNFKARSTLKKNY